MPVSTAVANVGADDIEVSADRQTLGHDPQHHSNNRDIDGRKRNAMEDLGQARETIGQAHAEMLAVGVPVGHAVEQRPGAHGGDEIDTEKRHREGR